MTAPNTPAMSDDDIVEAAWDVADAPGHESDRAATDAAIREAIRLTRASDRAAMQEALGTTTAGGERERFSRIGHHIQESSWHVHLAGFCSADEARAALAKLTGEA